MRIKAIDISNIAAFSMFTCIIHRRLQVCRYQQCFQRDLLKVAAALKFQMWARTTLSIVDSELIRNIKCA